MEAASPRPRILLVEDEQDHQELLRRGLERSPGGFRVELAETLAGAARVLERDPPDLVLCDWLLPDGKGIELLEVCRARPVPVVLMTSYGDERLAVESIKAGVLDYLVKSPEAFAEIQRIAARALREWAHRLEGRRAQEALRRSEERNRRLLQAVTGYIQSLPAEAGGAGPAVHGEGCAQVTGYPPEAFARDPDLWMRLVHPEDRAKVSAARDAALAGGEAAAYEHRILHADGGTRWLQAMLVPLRDASGRLGSLDIVLTDITGRKEAEEQARLRQRLLLQADKMASLGVLVAGVAHEINNPNNLVMLNADVLKGLFRGLLPALDRLQASEGGLAVAGLPFPVLRGEIDNLLRGLSYASERIRDIVTGLKDFARVDADRLDQEVDLNQVVESALLIAGNLIRNSTDHFSRELAPGLPKVRGNAQQLAQVAINLLTNACQALTDRSQPIRIRTAAGDGEARIEVEDGGAGMDPGQLARIFDPFYTTKREKGGTGLGLAISYSIMRAHGGELHYRSGPGRGCLVAMALPVAGAQSGPGVA